MNSPQFDSADRDKGADASAERQGKLGVPMTLPSGKSTRKLVAKDAQPRRFQSSVASSALFTGLALLVVAIKVGAVSRLLATIGAVLAPVSASLRRRLAALVVVRRMFRLVVQLQGARDDDISALSDEDIVDGLKRVVSRGAYVSGGAPVAGAGSDGAGAVEDPDPSAMSVTELKEELASRDVPHGGVFDRLELEVLVRQSRDKPRVRPPKARTAPPPPPPASKAEDSLDVDELRNALKDMPGLEADADMSEEVMARMTKAMSDPEAMATIRNVVSNPKCLAAMQDLASRGQEAYAKYENDPEVMEALAQLSRVLGLQ